ncbi:MAG: DUF3024 domain-containing protein, partial [Actinomycetia bacterium]|nr:DUF3024 domain-containing protein [Actinomycetes bacterium]
MAIAAPERLSRRKEWSQYWRDRHLMFHEYDLVEPTPHIDELGAGVKRDPTLSPSPACPGVVASDARTTSLAVAATIFGGFAIGRLASRTLDGEPNKDLLQGTMAEI